MCAKIFIRGRNPIEIENQTAKELKEEWENKTMPEKVDLGDNIFLSRDIKGLEGILSEEKKRETIDDPAYREKIKQFERDFLNWLEKNLQYKGKAFSAHKWFEELGAASELNIIDSVLYVGLSRKWSDFQELRYRREMATGTHRSFAELMGDFKAKEPVLLKDIKDEDFQSTLNEKDKQDYEGMFGEKSYKEETA